jgi:hypothetical protein
VKPEDLERFGLIPEIIGRLPAIAPSASVVRGMSYFAPSPLLGLRAKRLW